MKSKQKNKKTEIKQLRKLLEQIPEKAVETRKVYSAKDLMGRIKEVCSANPSCMSKEDLIYNLLSVGKRIAYIRNEFNEAELDAMIKYAISFLLDNFGQDKEWRKTAIFNIEAVFREHEYHYHSFKELF